MSDDLNGSDLAKLMESFSLLPLGVREGKMVVLGYTLRIILRLFPINLSYLLLLDEFIGFLAFCLNIRTQLTFIYRFYLN